MPETIEYGPDKFPPGDRKIWEEWYKRSREAAPTPDPLAASEGNPEPDTPVDGWEEESTTPPWIRD